jgi:hypothetical protein
MTRIIELLRKRGLLAKRSIAGWVLAVIGLVWKALGHGSTLWWVSSFFQQNSASQSAMSTPMPDGSIISLVLFFVGIAWLTAIVFIPFLRPNIYAKILCGAFIARNPYDELTRSAYQLMKMPLGPSEHDFVMKIFLVNRSIWPTTIQRIEAEAEIDGQWIKLKPCDLDHYADERITDQKLVNSPLRNIFTKKLPLVDLQTKLRDETLSRGVHRDGWVAYGLQIEPDKVEKQKVNLRMTIIDALDGRHPVLDVGEIDHDARITYSDKAVT